MTPEMWIALGVYCCMLITFVTWRVAASNLRREKCSRTVSMWWGLGLGLVWPVYWLANGLAGTLTVLGRHRGCRPIKHFTDWMLEEGRGR